MLLRACDIDSRQPFATKGETPVQGCPPPPQLLLLSLRHTLQGYTTTLSGTQPSGTKPGGAHMATIALRLGTGIGQLMAGITIPFANGTTLAMQSHADCCFVLA